MLWAFEEYWPLVSIAGDAQVVTKACQNPMPVMPWAIAPLIQNIKRMVADNPHWSFSFVPCSANWLPMRWLMGSQGWF